MVELGITKNHRMYFEHGREIGLEKKEPVTISSVGVLVHTGELSSRGDPSFLFVERIDHPEDAGWGIPAGRTEEFDKLPVNSGVRELRQETGLIAKPHSLVPFAFIDKRDDETTIRAVYSYKCHLSRLLKLGNFNKRGGILITSKNEPISDEIRRLAIIPRFKLFDRGSKVIINYIKWDVMHWTKARLEGLRII